MAVFSLHFYEPFEVPADLDRLVDLFFSFSSRTTTVIDRKSKKAFGDTADEASERDSLGHLATTAKSGGGSENREISDGKLHNTGKIAGIRSMTGYFRYLFASNFGGGVITCNRYKWLKINGCHWDEISPL